MIAGRYDFIVARAGVGDSLPIDSTLNDLKPGDATARL